MPTLTRRLTMPAAAGGAASGSNAFGLYEEASYTGGTLLATTSTSAPRPQSMFRP